MDRFACYLPGWEMPKTSSAYLTDRFGLITDYLAEAFHHQLKHNNRYEEVSSRVQLGNNVEGRDEKGIKKTICAFLKILHPDGSPNDEEFFEYVEYAIECRRRVKEQMNKRKPDEEFALINLSYITPDGKDIVVYCPETRGVSATLEPARRTLSGTAPQPKLSEDEEPFEDPNEQEVAAEPIGGRKSKPLEELHFTIFYGDVGHTYDSIVGPYLEKAKRWSLRTRTFVPRIKLQTLCDFVRRL